MPRETPVFNEIAKSVNRILQRSDPMRAVPIIKPRPAIKSGQRARRAAFYHRARMARLLTRIARIDFAGQAEELQMRLRNAVVYGTSHPERML